MILRNAMTCLFGIGSLLLVADSCAASPFPGGRPLRDRAAGYELTVLVDGVPAPSGGLASRCPRNALCPPACIASRRRVLTVTIGMTTVMRILAAPKARLPRLAGRRRRPRPLLPEPPRRPRARRRRATPPAS